MSALRDPVKCPWMSLSELAELIGVSRMTVRKWLVHSPHRLPPAIQLTPGTANRRGVTRFRRVDVSAWLKEHMEGQSA